MMSSSSSEEEEPFSFPSYQPRRPRESQESQPPSSLSSADQSQSNIRESEFQTEQVGEEDEDDEWSPSTPSIHSADSGELHETRPNRWKGHPSTWRTWTKNERRVWQGLEGTRKKDLGIHLFNVWGVRNGYRETPRDDIDEDTNKKKEQKGWNLGTGWTAWPLRASEVPGDDLLQLSGDEEDDQYTFRKEEKDFAGRNLEEEISAAVLRAASKRLRRRVLGKQAQVGHGVVQSVENEQQEEVTEEDAELEEEDEGEEGGNAKKKRKLKHVEPTFTPVISADDERNYALVRPAARRIMDRLDATLMVLHNSRVAGLADDYGPEIDEEEEEFWEKRQMPERQETPREARGRNLGGRPKKVKARLDGETEEGMAIRLAKEGKRRMPSVGADGEDRGRGRGLLRGRSSRSVSRRSSRRSRTSGSRSSSASSTQSGGSHIDRWKPRDWRDVLGAAALAGFSPEVIARATQRCATLFRGEMTMNTLHEQPVTSDKARVQTARYVPGVPLPASSDEDEDDGEQDLIQRRTISRQPSTSATTPAAEDATPAKAASTPRRSRSATPGGGHFCPYATCPRAIDGFTRKANLTRHIKLMHTNRAATPEPAEEQEEQDSMDEMEGGVHVDGFLKPIKVRRGWRGEDAGQRARRYQKNSSVSARNSEDESDSED
ncbi:hypothetical protein QBC42DRAFT_51488 [Cladorrhinum samala]|uniref:Rrn9 domain-containing protein n=1 Tax=Cladorrhinum samala TaxID=585594 RepID=A0AAV9H810_9PEZI|nr:hypothetical protein QBC42DRAFT_51488 [Cladorrhinum samala]